MKFKVKGIHCKGCETLIKDILEDEGLKNVSIEPKTGVVEAEGKADLAKIKKELKKEGYDIE